MKQNPKQPLTIKGLQVLPTLLNLITVGEVFMDVNPLDTYGLPGMSNDDKLDGIGGMDGK